MSPNRSKEKSPFESNSDYLSPTSVAIIGASRDPSKIGSKIVNNILEGGYQGEVYPINPKATEIQGLRAYASVLDIPADVDLAVIAIPAQYVNKVLDECGRKNIETVVIISAGFKETGPVGGRLEEDIVKTAEHYNIRLIGPNCLGFMNTEINLNATFSATTAKPGNLILFSQSGAFGTAILDWANQVNLGFRHFVSIGNKSIVDENELLRLWKENLVDSNENIILAGYLEDIQDGREFMELTSQITKKHPVVLLKAGKSEHASKAISLHTGSLATDDNIVDTALNQSGCIRTSSIEELFDTIQLLSRQPVPRGKNVAIITNAGGPGVAATDMIESSPLDIAELTETTKYTLNKLIPPEASTENPIDILGDAKADRYETALNAVLIDQNVDSVLVILTPQAVTEVTETANVISETIKKYPNKPVVTVFIGGNTVKPGVEMLNQYRMPVFQYPADAIKALTNAYEYFKATKLPSFKPEEPNLKSEGRIKAATIINSTSEKNIVGRKAEALIDKYDIPIPNSIYLDPGESPPDVELILGFPVVAKVISSKVLHKTEYKAVKLNIQNQKDLEKAIQELNNEWHKNSPDDLNFQVQVQRQIQGGENIILGFKSDPNFGPVLIFGSGGIFTELFKDVSRRIVPIDKKQAKAMISETKIAKRLSGFRGSEPKDLETVADTIVKCSKIAIENPEIKEFDINPYIVLNNGEGGFAVDVKVVLK